MRVLCNEKELFYDRHVCHDVWSKCRDSVDVWVRLECYLRFGLNCDDDDFNASKQLIPSRCH